MNADGLSHEMRARIQARVDAAASRARTVVSDAGLTERELDALAGAAAGETAEETAERLGIGEATVKSHRKLLLLRLGAVTMGHAIALVYRGGRGAEIDARLPAQDAPRREGRRL